MSEHRNEIDDVSGVATTGHEWDGIKELDNPLPRWWLIIFYATIAFAAVYWVMMPAWPTLSGFTHGVRNYSDRAVVAQELDSLRSQRAPEFARLMQVSAEQAEQDPALMTFARAAGRAAFGDNCATCHGAGAQGAKGYPNLNDNVWIWGGTLEAIETTLRVGIRSDHPEARFSQMPAYGADQLLDEKQIADAAEYVVSLAGGPAKAEAAARGAAIFAEQCTACHGADGKGNRDLGAPNLTTGLYLKADPAAVAEKDWTSLRTAIVAQIHSGAGGVMPTWEQRLDPGTIRALAIYVHSLGGGESTSATEPTGDPALAAPNPTR